MQHHASTHRALSALVGAAALMPAIMSGPQAAAQSRPPALSSCSAVYLVPIANEPNLNGDLMQSSLTGAHPVRLMRQVSDFYPLPNGGILAVRRDSRSGFTLLYREPGANGSVREIDHAFAYGGAALGPGGKEWAAFRRTGFAGKWVLAHAPLSGGTVTEVDVPDGMRSGSLEWNDERLLAHISEGERSSHYEIVADAEGWSLRKLGAYDPSHGASILLNKSESLEVTVVGQGNGAATRVSTVWFTGEERTIATIDGFVFREMTPAPDLHFVFLSGTRDGVPAAYTVVLRGGQVIPLKVKGARAARLCYLPDPAEPKRTSLD